MDHREEILNAVSGDRFGVPPAAIFTQSATVSQLKEGGLSWSSVHTDPNKMVDLALMPSKMFGFHSVRVPFCVTIEAERLGCKVDLSGDYTGPKVLSSPFVGKNGFDDPPQFLSASEFVSGGRCETVTQAVRILANGYSDEHAVIAGVTGPLTALTQIIGAENLLTEMIMYPERITKWLVAINPLICEYAQCLSDAGADVIQMSEASASPAFIAPEDFDKYAGRYVRRFARIKGTHTSLHICGDVTDILADMVSTGVDALSIESSVDPFKAVQKVNSRAALIGNVGPIRSLFEGVPDDVRRDAAECASAGFSVIAPGCGVPLMTKDENMYALAHYNE